MTTEKITLSHFLCHNLTRKLSCSFCPTEQSGGGAAEGPTPRRHQGVQVPGGSSATGLQRVRGGKHCVAETSVCAQTEPGNL